MTGTSAADDIQAEDFEDVVNELAKLQTAKMQIGCIAVVVSYDATSQKCSCRPVVRGAVKGQSAGVKWPIISNVPVRFPAAGNFSLTFPIVAGDFVWLDFGDRSIDDWLNSGADDVTPASKRRFHISDAVAHAGVRPFSKPLKSADVSALVLGQDEYDGPISNPGSIAAPLQLRISPSGIRLGDGGASLDLLNILHDTLVAVAAGVDSTASPLVFPVDVGLVALIARIDALRQP